MCGLSFSEGMGLILTERFCRGKVKYELQVQIH